MDKRTELKREYIKQVYKNQNPIEFIQPLEYQKGFYNSNSRNQNIIGGNRSGKTFNAACKVIRFALNNPNSDITCATWADLSVPVQQTKVFELLPKNNKIKYAQFTHKRGFANKIIIFENNSIIRFKTYEQGRESFQGTAKDIIWLDEEAGEDIVNECLARLIDRNGILLRSFTPLNGITYSYDDIILNEKNIKDIEYWYWDSSDNSFINQDALSNIINSYSKNEAEVRKTGHFKNLTTGNAYYPFTDNNIIRSFEYLNYRPLEVSCDFNIDLMCWNIGQEINCKDYTFDFVELEGQANTELLCQMLKNKFVNHSGGWIFYGDIAGNQRRPEASKTNWAIIKENFPSANIYYKNIRNIKDRIDSTNGRICNFKNEINYYVTDNCKRLIKDFRQVTWEMLLNKNKAGKLTHASDGESYKLYWKYPLTGKLMSKQF